jgi:hypothetical protein
MAEAGPSQKPKSTPVYTDLEDRILLDYMQSESARGLPKRKARADAVFASGVLDKCRDATSIERRMKALETREVGPAGVMAATIETAAAESEAAAAEAFGGLKRALWWRTASAYASVSSSASLAEDADSPQLLPTGALWLSHGLLEPLYTATPAVDRALIDNQEVYDESIKQANSVSAQMTTGHEPSWASGIKGEHMVKRAGHHKNCRNGKLYAVKRDLAAARPASLEHANSSSRLVVMRANGYK